MVLGCCLTILSFILFYAILNLYNSYSKSFLTHLNPSATSLFPNSVNNLIFYFIKKIPQCMNSFLVSHPLPLSKSFSGFYFFILLFNHVCEENVTLLFSKINPSVLSYHFMLVPLFHPLVPSLLHR